MTAENLVVALNYLFSVQPMLKRTRAHSCRYSMFSSQSQSSLLGACMH